MTCKSCAIAVTDPLSGAFDTNCIDCACRLLDQAGTKNLRKITADFLTRLHFDRETLLTAYVKWTEK